MSLVFKRIIRERKNKNRILASSFRKHISKRGRLIHRVDAEKLRLGMCSFLADYAASAGTDILGLLCSADWLSDDEKKRFLKILASESPVYPTFLDFAIAARLTGAEPFLGVIPGRNREQK